MIRACQRCGRPVDTAGYCMEYPDGVEHVTCPDMDAAPVPGVAGAWLVAALALAAVVAIAGAVWTASAAG